MTAVMEGQAPMIPCPECRQGKCRNCTVTVFSLDTDEWVGCLCAHQGHAR
jgi:hypothetical protein